MTYFAQLLGTFLGYMIKSMGADGVEALARGLNNVLIEKAVVSKPNSDLQSEFDGVRNDGNSAPK